MNWQVDAATPLGKIVTQLVGRPLPPLAPKASWDEPLRKRILDLCPDDLGGSATGADEEELSVVVPRRLVEEAKAKISALFGVL